MPLPVRSALQKMQMSQTLLPPMSPQIDIGTSVLRDIERGAQEKKTSMTYIVREALIKWYTPTEEPFVKMFLKVFQKATSKIRNEMYHLRKDFLQHEVGRQMLSELDTRVKAMEPSWPYPKPAASGHTQISRDTMTPGGQFNRSAREHHSSRTPMIPTDAPPTPPGSPGTPSASTSQQFQFHIEPEKMKLKRQPPPDAPERSHKKRRTDTRQIETRDTRRHSAAQREGTAGDTLKTMKCAFCPKRLPMTECCREEIVNYRRHLMEHKEENRLKYNQPGITAEQIQLDEEEANLRSVARPEDRKALPPTHLQTYFKFCTSIGCDPVHITEKDICGFATFLFNNRKLTTTTVRAYLKVSSVLRDEAGLPDVGSLLQAMTVRERDQKQRSANARLAQQRGEPGTFPCNERKCRSCFYVCSEKTIKDKWGNTKHTIYRRFSCKYSGVVYLISCKNCNLGYVGQTQHRVSKRIKEHLDDIKNKNGTSVANHFNSCGHSVDRDFGWKVIWQVKGVENLKENLNKQESFFIKRLQTRFPHGLNQKL